MRFSAVVILSVFLAFFSSALRGAETSRYDLENASPDYSWRLSGQGNDVVMLLSLHNLTDKPIQVTLGRGAVFTPAGGGVQRMVAKESVVFILEAKAVKVQSIPVLCMDISKDPPRSKDTTWTLKNDADMKGFLIFIQMLTDRWSKTQSVAEKDAKAMEKLVDRYAVWRYQGATQEQIQHFLVTYRPVGSKPVPPEIAERITRMADAVIDAYRTFKKHQNR